MNVGAGALFPVPEQKMGSAYVAMAPSMVTVSDTLQQSEYATDVCPLHPTPCHPTPLRSFAPLLSAVTLVQSCLVRVYKLMP
jgi:hypothetical protein